MQTLQSTFRIEETERKDSLLEIISDKYCRIILESTMYKPKSAMEITAETKIPISTVYRRIQTLYDNKLLGTSGTITEEGKRYSCTKVRSGEFKVPSTTVRQKLS